MANKDKLAKKAQEAIKLGGHYDAPVGLPEIDALYELNPNETYHEVIFSENWKKHREKVYFDYRNDWESIPKQKLETPFPIHLDIETTNICNLRCPMCPRTILMAEDKFSTLGYMSKEQYKNIIDEAVTHNVKSIKLNYLGEPLSHPDVVWQIEYAKKMGIVDTMMNSNGALLKKKLAENLLDAGLDNLFISFDAINPKDFETQRLGTSIGKVIDNVYEFLKLREKINPGCQVRVSMVMYKDPHWLEQFECLKVMWKGLVDAVGYGYYVERTEDKQSDYPEVKGFYCAQPFQRMFLKYNGNVTICCVDDKDEVVVGNWHRDKLYDIWNGDEYKDIRKKHASGNYYDIAMCRKCYLPVSL